MASYQDFLSGTLRAKLKTGTTTGVTVKMRKVNNAYPTWETGAHQLVIVQETRKQTKVEKVNVASGTTQDSDGVVTLGTLTRAISLTDGTDTAGTGTAQTFSQGGEVYLSWTTTDAENTAMTDEANTFSELVTFSFVDFDTDGDEYFRVPVLTEAQRDALTAANGMMVYVTDGSNANRIHTYEGGAWGVSSSSTVADASATVAGKVEKATDAEIRAETATGGTGAPLFVGADATSVLKDDRVVLQDATELTIATGAITVTQPYHTVDTESDAASDDLDTITAAVGAGEIIVLRAADAARTVVVKDGTGNILLPSGDYSLDDGEKVLTLIYDGSNWRPLGQPSASYITAQETSSLLHVITADGSTVGASSTSPETMGTYTMPANTIVNVGDTLHIKAFADGVCSAGVASYRVTIGGTVVASGNSLLDTVDNFNISIDCLVTVRTAGASGVAQGTATMMSYDDGAAAAGLQEIVFASASSLDFTGALDIDIDVTYSSSHGSNGSTLKNFVVVLHRNS